MRRWFIFFAIGISASCIPEKNTKEKSTKFYDIDGLINEQVKMFVSINPSILKRANINGQEEMSDLNPIDSAEWSKELSIFKSMDLNRSILNDSYTISDSKTDLSTISYISKYPEATEVEELTITFDQRRKPVKIHALLENQNELFNSSKKLELQFVDYKGSQTISNFQIKGWQKMIAKDSTFFVINAEIIFP